MYDIMQEKLFIAVRSWINSVQKNMEDGMPAAMLLVGNKSDLETNKREVLTETGETFSKVCMCVCLRVCCIISSHEEF